MAASYRHDKRAGNFGDVHKHVALLSALSATTGAANVTSNWKVMYIETHAASGSYESTSSKAEDTGVGRVLAADEWQTIMSQDIQAYADTIKRYCSEGAKPKHGYPGSPLLALSCCHSIGNNEGALVGSGIALIHRHGDMVNNLMSMTKELYGILASSCTNSGSWSVLEC